MGTAYFQRNRSWVSDGVIGRQLGLCGSPERVAAVGRASCREPASEYDIVTFALRHSLVFSGRDFR